MFRSTLLITGLALATACGPLAKIDPEGQVPSDGDVPIRVSVPEDQSDSVLGRDQDNNGVRDDIDLWIEKERQFDDTSKTLLTEYAKSIMQVAPLADDKIAVLTKLKEQSQHLECFRRHFAEKTSTKKFIEAHRALHRYLWNSDSRRDVLTKINQHAAGQVFRRPTIQEGDCK